VRIRTVSVSIDYNRFSQLGKHDMKDVISINRAFLLHARSAASDNSGTLVTGMTSEELNFFKDLSIDQIEQLATSMPTTGFVLRFKVEHLKRMVETPRQSFNPQYALSLLSGSASR